SKGSDRKRKGPESGPFFISTDAINEPCALDAGAAAPRESSDQRDHKDHQEDEEQQFGDSGRCHCNTAETEDRGNDCHNQKNQRPIKHVGILQWFTCEQSIFSIFPALSPDDQAESVIQAPYSCTAQWLYPA